jgi:t-SNARE complex subunit (syntaxin)
MHLALATTYYEKKHSTSMIRQLRKKHFQIWVIIPIILFIVVIAAYFGSIQLNPF